MRKLLLAAALLAVSALPATAANLIANGGFAHGADPWWKSPLELKQTYGSGEMCTGIPGGSVEIWDLIVGQNDISLKKGVKYRFSFKARATPDGTVRALVQMPMPPWTPYGSLDQKVGADQATYTIDFTATETRKNAQVAFQFGGAKDAWLLCLDDVTLVTR